MTHLDVMSIRTKLDAQMTINRQVDWSSPSEERSTGDRESRSRLPTPRPMPNTMPSELAAWDSYRSRISWTSSASRRFLTCSPIHSHWSRVSRTESTAELQLHTLQPSTILLQIWLETERSTWATYRLLRCSPTASQSHFRSLPSWCSVLRWEWSGMDSGIASEMDSVRSEMVAGMVSELEMEKASGMPSESTLIGHICFEEIHDVWLATLLLCLRFFVWNGRDSRSGGVLSWLGVRISLCQGLWCNLPLL